MCIYIYIERERDRAREREMHISYLSISLSLSLSLHIYIYIYIYIYIHVLKPTPKAYLQSSNHQAIQSPSHAIGIWRSSWSRSLQFQLKSESGVPSLETSKGGPPPWVAAPGVDPYPPEAPNFSLYGRPFSPSCLILALLAAILAHLGALRPHLVAKLLQDGAQMVQHSAKISQQHGLQEGPPDQKTFLCFRPVWKDRTQDTKKVTKTFPKARQVGILGTSWRHLGAKLANIASSRLQLDPSWCQDAPQQASTGSPRCLPTRILHHLGAKRVPKVLQDSPKARFSHMFHHLGDDFGPISIFSISLLIEFRNRFCLRCLIFFSNFCFQSAVLKSQVSAHWQLVARMRTGLN